MKVALILNLLQVTCVVSLPHNRSVKDKDAENVRDGSSRRQSNEASNSSKVESVVFSSSSQSPVPTFSTESLANTENVLSQSFPAIISYSFSSLAAATPFVAPISVQPAVKEPKSTVTTSEAPSVSPVVQEPQSSMTASEAPSVLQAVQEPKSTVTTSEAPSVLPVVQEPKSTVTTSEAPSASSAVPKPEPATPAPEVPSVSPAVPVALTQSSSSSIAPVTSSSSTLVSVSAAPPVAIGQASAVANAPKAETSSTISTSSSRSKVAPAAVSSSSSSSNVAATSAQRTSKLSSAQSTRTAGHHTSPAVAATKQGTSSSPTSSLTSPQATPKSTSTPRHSSEKAPPSEKEPTKSTSTSSHTTSTESITQTPAPFQALAQQWVTAVIDGQTVSWINTYDGSNSGDLVHATINGQPQSWTNVYDGRPATGPYWVTAVINEQTVSWLENGVPATATSAPPPSSSTTRSISATGVNRQPSPVSIPQGSTKTVVITTELETTLTVSEVQTVTVTKEPTSGVAHTSLQMSGQATVVPFNTTSLPTPASAISPVNQGPDVISSTQSVSPAATMSGNIFVPLATGAPPSQITTRGNHPVPRQGIVNQGPPLQTNKFYANFFLGNRNQSTFTHPYSLAWVKGYGASGSYGISVSHVDRDRTVYGPGNPARYYVNPLGLQSMILSAQELGSGTAMTMDSLLGFSANINLAPRAGATPIVTFPVVQGMGFVTGVYNQATPLIQTSIYFKGMMYSGIVSGTQIAKYTVSLNDGTTWLIYLRPIAGAVPTLTLLNTGTIIANHAFNGSVQVAKIPAGSSAGSVYDAHAGVYPLRGAVSASVQKNVGTYSLAWTKGGNVSRKLLMFALPHHIQTLQSGGSVTQVKLQTTTKGIATALVGDSWTLAENNLPYDMGFAPWSPTLRSQTNLPPNAQTLVGNTAAMELAGDIDGQTNLDSMYFSGKALAKFAMIVYSANNLARNTGVASAGLVKLKNAYARFVNNTQKYPLVFDSSWGGMVSSATYVTGDSGVDFGNTYYNDHHFHYGYFVYTAAVIGFLDPDWLKQGSNVAWTNALVRDYANSASNDRYFPFSRMFDWYHGHSWAHGLYETADGKDEESSSEDGFSSYALKMWGRTIGDANLEARGNLMLSLTARSLNNYFLMQSSNPVQPPQFIGNKADGILFENKVDHTTYFGTNIEYIEGIHMLPLNPSSTLTRNATFVREEWDTYFSNGRADAIQGGWKGILYANLAIIDAKTSYNFFASSNFQSSWLDGGASRTWYLAFAAGLGGAK